MAIVPLPTYPVLSYLYAINSLSTTTVTATNNRRAQIFEVAKSGTITHISVSLGAVTGGQTIRVSLQTVGTDGFPTGTLYGGSGAGTFTPVANSVNTATLSTPATVASGTMVAVVVEWDATVGTSVTLNYMVLALGLPNAATYTTVWTKTGSLPLAFSLRYSDSSEVGINIPVSSWSTITFNSGSTPNERGNMFRLPYGARISGLWLYGTMPAAPFDIVLYDASNTVLASKTYNSTYPGLGIYQFQFDSPVDIAANTWYRATLKATSATNAALREAIFISREVMESLSGGSDFYSTSRTGSGAWTDTDTRRHILSPLLSGIDSGGGTSTPSIFSTPIMRGQRRIG